LLLGADGYLCLSVGEEGACSDIFENSRRIVEDFIACNLRIDVDRRPGNPAPDPHPAVQPGTWAVPLDNPFAEATRFDSEAVAPAAVRTESRAVGLRKVRRRACDAATGRLWAAGAGRNSAEEIDVVVRGGNYGWNDREVRGRGLRRRARASRSLPGSSS
jgi:glucose/arabinose dehydrogenase